MLQWTLPVKLLLPIVTFGGIGLVVLPADFHAAAEKPLVSPAPVTMKPAFNAPAMPVEALNKAPTVSEPMPVPAAAAVTSQAAWRPSQAIMPVAVAAASAEPAGLPSDRINAAVNVRAAGRKGAPVLFVLPSGTPVRVAGTEGGWVHIFSDKGEGYVYASFIGERTNEVPQTDDASPPASKSFRVASSATVWDEPGGDPVYKLERGERIRIVETDGKWARIVTQSGEGGWVRLK
jgi:SH3-like domain-containing protein